HQARSDLEIFTELADRLGYVEAYTENRSEREWIECIYARCAQAQEKAGVTMPEFSRFWEEGFVELPMPDKDFILFEEFRADPERYPLKTPSGKIELFSKTIESYGYADCGPHPQWL